MTIAEILLLAFVILIMVILAPILIIVSSYTYIKNKIEARKFETYLGSNEGRRYFCYTNRRSSEPYVRQNILPSLPALTEIIYLSDKMWNLGNDTKFLNRLVARMKTTKGGFPYVSKVKNGKLITLSVNDRLYSAIKRNIDANAINEKIHRFLN